MTHSPDETVVILNPESGSGSHGANVRQRANRLGYTVVETDTDGDAVALAATAAERGVETLVAAGGDGTVNEVVRGIRRAGALDSVTVGVVPVGTGNNFAKQIGVTDVATAFDVVESGDRRRIDLGQANGHLFVNSCVAGLTADSSSKTSPAMKQRLGVLAYVVTTLRTVTDFESLRLTVAIDGHERAAPAWTGDALSVLIGNARQFGPNRTGPANVEDGLFDVTVIEDVPVLSLMSDAVVERLLGRDSAYITRFRAQSLAIEVHNPSSVRFSLDGEIIQERRLAFETLPRTLSVAVGDGYTPPPE
ncbi:diacylglycerol/lipid kinase family protein [Haloarcula salinisoli]|uniref:YegS/Rv2252/BmrU family lipid kinase n=1 Tax=Haloarcula salinisoli TaxID=2487746 RepID=A0A8J8CBX1_9EURY|nr:YegS/Rv2252/BmrU family lipid kinase [Halomicroarcula salinisoli]MBX0285682.1 YegS/Rv2252/BmrU family lipid kinase [Halomicroarcula salinisoli]MBX0302830.1 YegS/Rv2252/BmrU family lipid kinase [Halomicroarcula salinisoli]